MAQIVSCPECHKDLQVPDELMGKRVQCPQCQHAFAAEVITSIIDSPPPLPDLKPELDELDEVPVSRRRRDDVNNDDEEIRPRRKRREYEESHRGGLILTLGIVGLFFGGIILGPIAWIMGNGDMKKMRAGSMDPEGEGLTQAGRIMGMIATFKSMLVLLLICVWFGFFFFIVGIAAMNGPQPAPLLPRPVPQKF